MMECSATPFPTLMRKVEKVSSELDGVTNEIFSQIFRESIFFFLFLVLLLISNI